MSSVSSASHAPLSIAEAREVLRYFREALRAEEALTARPRARTVQPRTGPPRVDVPTPGQDYFKLAADDALAGMLFAGCSLEKPLEAELSAYFETWLHNQYRRAEADADAPHLVCFPAVHFARGELAGLLRAQVRLTFQTATGDNFRVPSRSDRARGRLPEAPEKAVLLPVARVPGALPLFVDTRLLNRTFAVPHERIDDFFDALRAREEPSEEEMVLALAALLEADEPDAHAARDEPPLSRLTRAAARRLSRVGARAKAYGVAFAVDGSSAKATWYLQQELKTLLADDDDTALASGLPLFHYLTHTKARAGQALCYGRFPGPPLTAVQQRVASEFWGSRFSAAQGPPGTGKTTLVLHLCADAWVRSIGLLADHGAPAARPFVIASSNNRAVDNVLAPLAELAGSGLPLALRAGSRQVMADELTHTLSRTRVLLQQAKRTDRAERSTHLKSALYDFVALRHRLRELLGPQEKALQRAAARESRKAELAELPPPATLSARAESWRDADPVALHALVTAGKALSARLEAQSELCAKGTDEAAEKRLVSHFKRTATRVLPAFRDALTRLGVQCELPLPERSSPAPAEAALAAWEEALERALDVLATLHTDLMDTLRERARRGRAAELTLQIHDAEASEANEAGAFAQAHDAATAASAHAAGVALFQAALRARTSWAFAHAEELDDALEGALLSLDEERSLRPFLRDGSARARLFFQLFGVWGCTLLSFGNVFPPDVASIAELVIDEAGQCHPAHAISGLLRSQRALVVGDVHQLAPVLELSRDDDARLRHGLRLALDARKLAPFLLHNQSDTSVQSIADMAVHTRPTLTDHFRCQPAIIALSDALCGYGLTVHTAPAARAELARLLPGPVVFMDVQGRQEELGGSYHNEAELFVTMQLLKDILAAGVAAADIALITPYRGQLERLQRACLAGGIPLEHSAELREGEAPNALARSGLALGTVHRFQGGERSVVLFSSVVSEARSLPFLNARPNLLNVAISRARHHFVTLGQQTVLGQGACTRILLGGAHRLAAPQAW